MDPRSVTRSSLGASGTGRRGLATALGAAALLCATAAGAQVPTQPGVPPTAPPAGQGWGLPGWGQPDAQGQQQPDSRSRREMQSFVDWLFARINVQEAGAVGLINDLVRVCILLASHAPVNQIIAGALLEAATVKQGGLVKIAVDPAVVRIGMPVAIYRKEEVVAHAVVSDLIGGLASAEVVRTVGTVVQLDKGARVQFGAASAAALMRLR